MIAKIAILAATPVVATALLLGVTGVAVVDVRETSEDNIHLTIPVPLVLAQAALAFAPDEAKYVHCPEFARYRDVAEKILLEMERIPDATLVEVQDGSDHVVIRKEGKVLKVNVESKDGETVECVLPIKGALKAVRSFDGEGFRTSVAFSALRSAPRGTLVHVKDGGDEVSIRLL